MSVYEVTITYRGEGEHKTSLENVVNQLRGKGAHIIKVQSRVGNVDEPPIPINIVTISYEAPREIKISADFVDLE